MKYINFYKCLFFFIVAFYALVLSRFGFENWDSGFLTAFNWRIINGELPYRDFIYIRPPVSAFFHGYILELLPEHGQLYLVRIISYLLFALQVYFVVEGTNRIYDLTSFRVNKWAVMTVCFMISRHNFYPGPWFTTDGLLFAAAAYYVLSCKNKSSLSVIIAAILCLFSALTKQSFYVVPIIFGFWVFVSHGLPKFIIFCHSGLVATGAIVFWLLQYTSLEQLTDQISGVASGSNTVEVGALVYVRAYHNRFILLLVLVAPLLVSLYRKRTLVAWSYLRMLSLCIFISAVVYAFIDFKQSSVILFNAVLIALLYKIRFRRETFIYYLPLIVLLTIAWCGGLSLGYPYPVLFCTGLIVAWVILMAQELQFKGLKLSYALVACTMSAIALTLNIKPYRENNISTMKWSLAAVSPKLKYIRSDRKTYEKYMELRNIVDKISGSYVVLPNSPVAYWLFDRRNPLSADWVTNFEIAGNTAKLQAEISILKPTVIIERSFISGEPLFENPTLQEQQEFSTVTLSHYQDFVPVQRKEYFLVYDLLPDD